SDSAFDDTPTSGAAAFGSHSDDGLRYSAGQRNFIQYNFSGGNGFFATVSLEDDDGAEYFGANLLEDPDDADFLGNPDAYYDSRNYVPDVVIRVGVNQGWGAVWAAAGWDEDRTNADSVAFDDALV